MSAKTSIAWTDRVWNPTIGCTRVSDAALQSPLAARECGPVPSGRPLVAGGPQSQQFSGGSVMFWLIECDDGEVRIQRDGRMIFAGTYKGAAHALANAMYDLQELRKENVALQAQLDCSLLELTKRRQEGSAPAPAPLPANAVDPDIPF